MAREDSERRIWGEMYYTYGIPDHIEEGEAGYKWWQEVTDRILESAAEGKLRGDKGSRWRQIYQALLDNGFF